MLGVLFTCIQAYEYAACAVRLRQNTYGSAFYMATGFHGFHVMVGTIFLTVCLIRAYQGPLHPAPAFRFRSGGVVLALRRRGVAVPVRGRLCLGRLGRAIPLMSPGRRSGTRKGQPAIGEAALFGLCPRCGARTLFAGSSRLPPRCGSAASTSTRFNVGDGPAAFLTLIVGAMVVGLAIWLQVSAEPPFWVHVMLWVPLTRQWCWLGCAFAKARCWQSNISNKAREAGQQRANDPPRADHPDAPRAGRGRRPWSRSVSGSWAGLRSATR